MAGLGRRPLAGGACRGPAQRRSHTASSCETWVGDLAFAVAPPWDLVVANLPYIPSADLSSLPVEVRHDPPAALDGGADGLDLIRPLIADLARLLRPCGGAILELGDDQAGAVARLASAAGLAVARRLRDPGGAERVIVLQPR